MQKIFAVGIGILFIGLTALNVDACTATQVYRTAINNQDSEQYAVAEEVVRSEIAPQHDTWTEDSIIAGAGTILSEAAQRYGDGGIITDWEDDIITMEQVREFLDAETESAWSHRDENGQPWLVTVRDHVTMHGYDYAEVDLETPENTEEPTEEEEVPETLDHAG